MPSGEVGIISLLVSEGHGTPEKIGWETSIPQVNAWLHATLIRRGHVCDWADTRASESGRTADRARARFQAFRQEVSSRR